MKKDTITEEQAKKSPAGGVLVGKREGQTIIHDKGTQGGYFVGKLHKEGGIKGINKSTGQPIEVQGGEVIITAPAVADQTKREFEGEMLTNREILSKINERGGGVSLENGGEIYYNGSSYNYGGKTMTDYEILQSMNDCGCEHEYDNGGSLSKGKSLEDIAKMHNVSVSHIKKQLAKGRKVESEHTSNKKEQERIAKDHLVENPNYYTILDEVGLKKGGIADSSPNSIDDVLDIHADGVFGGENGIMLGEAVGGADASFSDGGLIFDLKIGDVFKIDTKSRYGGLLLYVPKDDTTYSFDNGTELKLVRLDSGGDEGYKLFSLEENGEKVTVSIGNTSLKKLIEDKELLKVSFSDSLSLDFLDEAVKKFDDGGATKELVEYIEIWNTGGSLRSLIGNTYRNYKDLKKDLEEINQAYSYIYLGANGKSMGSSIDVKKDGKNTVRTINPTTSKAKDFEKAIKRSWGEWRFEKYDFSKWLQDDSKGKRKSKAQPQIQPQPTPKVKIDLSNTFINVNNDKALALDVIEKAEKLGWDENKAIKSLIRDNDKIEYIWFANNKYVGWSDNLDSINRGRTEITYDFLLQKNNIDLNNKKVWIGDDPKLSIKIQEKAFELGFYWEKGKQTPLYTDRKSLLFRDGEIQYNGSVSDYETFLSQDTDYEVITAEEIFEINKTSNKKPINLEDLSKSRLDVLKDILDLTNEKSLVVYPSNIVTDTNDDKKLLLNFVDLETGDVFDFVVDSEKSGLFPYDEKSSELAFEFLEFEKKIRELVDENLKKQSKAIFDENVADLDKIIVKYKDLDFEKEKRELEALTKLLPSFQSSKHARERAMILKEMDKLNRKITYEGFIFLNEQNSGSDNLFTPQGLLKYYWSQSTQSPIAPLEPACELPTPNGEKSKLPLSAYLNVRTPQFKKWFGDWEMAYTTGNYVDCSKLIDEETKEPKIFYHGVRKYTPNFGQFSNMGEGVVRPYGSFEPPSAFPASYFSDSEDYAKFYGGIAPNMPKPSDDYEPFIYKVFIKAKNPLSLVALGFEASYKNLIDYLLVAYGIKIQPNQNVLELIGNDMNAKKPVWVFVRNDVYLLEVIKDYGYDSFVQIGDIPVFDSNGQVVDDRSQYIQEKEYLTFYPNQIKSATVKKSYYFDFFKDIRFNKGGYVRI